MSSGGVLINHSLLDLKAPVALPVVVQSRLVSNNGSGTSTYTFASTPANGNLMILISGTGQAKTQTLAGWNVLVTDGGFIYVWWKIAGPAESNSYTIGITGSFNNAIYGYCFTGYNPVTPLINYSPAVSTTPTVSVTIPVAPTTILKFVYALVADSHSVSAVTSVSNSFTQVVSAQRLYVAQRQYVANFTGQNVTIVYPGVVSHAAVLFGVNPIIA